MSRDYGSDKYYEDNFDFEGARQDLYDAGLDPDYLSYRNREERDNFMRDHGFDPKKYGSRYTGSNSSGSSNSDEGCYLTTACIIARNLPDNCDELQTLRSYRDTYLRNRKKGPDEIKEYYEIAPKIVSKINSFSDSANKWNELYLRLVVPCVEMIKDGKFEEAYELYKSTTLSMKESLAL